MNYITEAFHSFGIEDLLENEPLSKHCTWRIGGPADILVYPKTIQELQYIISFSHENQIDLHFLGKGSNLLISDLGLRGVTVKLSKYFDRYQVEGNTVKVDAGYSLIKLATLISKEGLSGLEFSGGIPGSIGGAIRMNAGAHGSDMSKIVTSVRAMTETGKIIELSNEELQFSYRHSLLNEKPWIVLDATLQLAQGDRILISSKMKELKEHRLQTQPLKMRCCGSVFKNPLPEYAGHLIEQCGLKGKKIGDAQISPMHANFIVNLGNATAKDVLSLIHFAQNAVEKEFNISLTPEVKFVGMEMELA